MLSTKSVRSVRSSEAISSGGVRSSDALLSSQAVRSVSVRGVRIGESGGRSIGGGVGRSSSRRVVSSKVELFEQSFSRSSNFSTRLSSSEDAGLVVSELGREISSSFDETEKNKGSQFWSQLGTEKRTLASPSAREFALGGG